MANWMAQASVVMIMLIIGIPLGVVIARKLHKRRTKKLEKKVPQDILNKLEENKNARGQSREIPGTDPREPGTDSRVDTRTEDRAVGEPISSVPSSGSDRPTDEDSQGERTVQIQPTVEDRESEQTDGRIEQEPERDWESFKQESSWKD